VRRGKPLPRQGPGFNPDVPTEGFYRIRLRPRCPPVALRFWRGPPLDPETQEPMDRSPVWQCRMNGTELIPVDRFWPRCARDPITRAEHDRLCDMHRTLDPDDPYYDATKPIDPMRTPLPFLKEDPDA
jgi:hypothetical protein